MDKLYFNYAGLHFRVDATINDGCVEDIATVEVMGIGGKYEVMKVDRKEFLKTMQDTLDEAVEQAKLDARLAYEDMLLDQAKEEGRL